MKWETVCKRQMTARELSRRKQVAQAVFGHALDMPPSQIQVEPIVVRKELRGNSIFRCTHSREGWGRRIVLIFAPYAEAYDVIEAIVEVNPEEDGYYGNIHLMWRITKGCWYTIEKKKFCFTKKIRRKTLDWYEPQV